MLISNFSFGRKCYHIDPQAFGCTVVVKSYLCSAPMNRDSNRAYSSNQTRREVHLYLFRYHQYRTVDPEKTFFYERYTSLLIIGQNR